MFIGLFKTDIPFKIFPLNQIMYITIDGDEIIINLCNGWVYTTPKDCVIKTIKEINYDFREC